MRTVLFVLGDFYHCSDQLVMATRAMDLPADVSTELVRYPDAPDPDRLIGYDLVVFAMMGRLDPERSEETWFHERAQLALTDHVASGAGLLVVHAGTASHPTDGPFRELVGGHFLHHPPEHPPVTISPVATHPITEGVGAFAHPDEHYFMDVDEGVTELLRATSELGDQSAGWCREHGDGRVAVLVPGHTRQMLAEPMLRRLLSNAAAWCLNSVE
ncbi:MAG: ThuA domain-containing protein [Spirochaetota bacterium]